MLNYNVVLPNDSFQKPRGLCQCGGGMFEISFKGYGISSDEDNTMGMTVEELQESSMLNDTIEAIQ